MSYSAEVLADSPIAYWRLGESSGTAAADASGNGRTATYTNGPTLGQAGALFGDSDKSPTFDGSNDHVATPIAISDLPVAGPWTVEAWARCTIASGARAVLSLGNSDVYAPADHNVAKIERGVTGHWFCSQYDGVAAVPPTVPAAVGAWTHLVMVNDGTNILFYVNGTLAGSAARRTPSVHASARMRIGGNGVYGPFQGQIDEVAVYATALSAARVAAHYRAGVSAYAAEVSKDSPTLYWRLDETTGTVAADASGFGRHGTYTNGPTLNQATALAADTGSKSVSFDGTNDRVVAGVGAAALPVTAAHSWECWVYPTTTAPSYQAIIYLGNSLAYSPNYHWDGLEISGGKLRYKQFDGTDVAVEGSLTLNSWHHVVCVHDGTLLHIYVNGVEVGTPAAKRSPNISASATFRVGTDQSGSGAFAGRIDEVAFYPFALSAARISAHYNAGLGLTTGTSHSAGANATVSLSGLAGYARATSAGAIATISFSGLAGAVVPPPTGPWRRPWPGTPRRTGGLRERPLPPERRRPTPPPSARERLLGE